MKVLIISLVFFLTSCYGQCDFMKGRKVAVLEENSPLTAGTTTCNMDTSTFSCVGDGGNFHGTYTVENQSNGWCRTVLKSQTFGFPDQCYTYQVGANLNASIGCLKFIEGCTPYTSCSGNQWNLWGAWHVVGSLDK